VLALDLPSGLDATTGTVAGVAVRAAATLTLAAPKTGLTVAGAAPYVGDLYLADVGVPPEAFRGLGGTSLGGTRDPRSWFAGSDVLRLERGTEHRARARHRSAEDDPDDDAETTRPVMMPATKAAPGD
jgi:hypothetical protein